jgi:hypothetical protein
MSGFVLPMKGPLGNSLDTRAVALHVMNNVVPTRAQLTAVEQVFNDHMTTVGLSLAAYHVEEQRLADGSVLRIVSNSGQHNLMLWPAPVDDQAYQYLGLFFAVPAANGAIYNPPDPKLSHTSKFRAWKDAAPATLKPARKITDADAIAQHPGNLTWWTAGIKTNEQPLIVSWWGRESRYGRLGYFGLQTRLSLGFSGTSSLYGPQDTSARLNWHTAHKPAVWTNGVKHRIQCAGVDMPVMSAGMKKEGDALVLWIISHEPGSGVLKVYKGEIDPYKAGTTEVAYVFDAGFTIERNILSTDPWWETPIQPLFFNASCTKVAGLVAVRKTALANPAASAAIGAAPGGSYCVALMQLDLATGTASFDASHPSASSTVIADDHTGAPDFGGSEPYEATNEQWDFTIQREAIRYGAVDFQGDQLLIALVRDWSQLRCQDSGTFYVMSGETRTFTKDRVKSAKTGFRVYLAHNDQELAKREPTTWAPLGQLHFNSSSFTSSEAGVPNEYHYDGWVRDQSSEVLNVETLIEGGDLRHGRVLLAELVEHGNSNVYWETSADSEVVNPFDPGSRTDPTPFIYDRNPGVRNFTAENTARRQPGLRASAWDSGTLMDTTDVQAIRITGTMPFGNANTAYASMFGFGPPNTGEWPIGTGLVMRGDELFKWQLPALPSALNYDALPAPPTSTTWTGAQSGLLHWVGTPYTLASAHSPDGKYWFYGLASSAKTTGTPFNPVQTFVIEGAKYPAPSAAYLPEWTPTDPVLESPVFVDTVPELKDQAPKPRLRVDG